MTASKFAQSRKFAGVWCLPAEPAARGARTPASGSGGASIRGDGPMSAERVLSGDWGISSAMVQEAVLNCVSTQRGLLVFVSLKNKMQFVLELPFFII
jgi:hypothetical protein